MTARAMVGVVVVLFLAGCPARDDGPLGLDAGCQPLLGGHHCLLPYPSDFFRTAEGRVVVGDGARLLSKNGANADVHQERARVFDGFSRLSTAVAVFDADVSAEGLNRLQDGVGGTMEPSSRSLWLDADTNTLVPHFVDLDPRAVDPKRRAVVLHALVPLEEGHRYVLALQGLTQTDGQTVAAPIGFARLRDRRAKGDPQLEALAARYDSQVFAPLEALGVSRAGLQLAWDFTTGSDAAAQRDTLRVRALTLAWLESNRSTFTVSSFTEAPSPGLWRTVKGTFTAPLFLEKSEAGALLARDAQGEVVQNGTHVVPYTLVVPTVALDGGVPIVGYGHGFFGTQNELESPGGRELAPPVGMAMLATDWQGMSTGDIAKVVDDLQQRPFRAARFTERVPQGLANFLVLLTEAPKGLRTQPELQGPNGPVLGTESRAFLGISQGHILGATLSALAPNIERYLGNVGGAGLTHMMFRAKPFEGFLFFLEEALPDPLDQQAYAATLQRPFDTFDPGVWAPKLLDAPLPGSPKRTVALQTGLGDTGVPNLGSFLHARALKAPLFMPSPREPWGLPPTTAPTDRVITLFDFGLDEVALYSKAQVAIDTPVHLKLRTEKSAQAQMKALLIEGKLVHPCDGPCDPN